MGDDERRRGTHDHRSGRHHRVRPMWHMDTCSSCGALRHGRYDGYRGDVVDPRTSRLLTANRLAAAGSSGSGRSSVRIEAGAVVLAVGVVLLVLGPCLGWLVLG